MRFPSLFFVLQGCHIFSHYLLGYFGHLFGFDRKILPVRLPRGVAVQLPHKGPVKTGQLFGDVSLDDTVTRAASPHAQPVKIRENKIPIAKQRNGKSIRAKTALI